MLLTSEKCSAYFITINTVENRFGAPSWRLAWLIPGGVALLMGLDAGLLLLGLPAPITTDRLPEVHGMLLTLGFVATLVSLERATALGHRAGYTAPALLGLGGLLLIATPVPLVVGKAVLLVGTLAFTAVYVPLWRRNYDATLLVQLLAAGLAVVASLIWMTGADFRAVVPWLIGFLVLTIAAERVELARITMKPHSGKRLLLHATLVTLALCTGFASPDFGARALGWALLALLGWLVWHDVARRTIRSTGVTQYMAACILAGYVWLTVAAVVLIFGEPRTPAAYDAVVHSVLLGYTFSMIMAHATTILPAVLRVRLPFNRWFWVPISLLQLALLVRIGVGDLGGITAAWRWGSVLALIALLAFVATALITAVIAARRHTPARPRYTNG